MAKKLHYFNFNGIAESIRYILHYGKHEFEDLRYGTNENLKWPNEKIKELLPLGQMPLYQEGDRNLNQSVAIARYVGTISNLVPTDPWDQAILDASVLNIYDLWFKVADYFRETDPAKKEEKKKTFLAESIDYFFTRYEDQLAKNNGFFGGTLSWADFVFVGIVESINVIFGAEVESKYPNAAALIQKIINLPGVKEYIATRKPYSL